MTHQAEAVLACIAVIGMLLILGNMTYTFPDGTKKTGFNAILGNSIVTASESYDNYKDDDVLQQEIGVDKPKIAYISAGQPVIKAGITVPILDYFNVTYGNGDLKKASAIPEVKVEDILDQNQRSVLDLYDSGQKTITFSSAGIYTIKLYVRDQENRETTVQIKIPVGGGL